MELLPRAPIVRPKSGTVDTTDNYASKLKRFREGAKSQAIREARENVEWENVARFIAALEGNFWNLRGGAPRPTYRSRFVDNQIARARKDAIALYTDASPDARITSHLYSDQARILMDLMIHQWTKRDMDIRLVEVIDYALFGVGYAKIDASPGSLTIGSAGMGAVMPINGKSDIQGSDAILYRTVKSLLYFYGRFRPQYEAIRRSATSGSSGERNFSRGALMTEAQWNSLSTGMQSIMRHRRPNPGTARNDDVFPVADLEEYWIEDPSENESGRDVIVCNPSIPIENHNYWYRVKPGNRLFPRKRLMVFGGDVPCYDGPGPYWTPRYPFARLALDPVVWAPGGISKYRALLPLNDAINEIGAGVIDVIRKAINQTVAYKQGTVASADWDRFFPDMPGAKLRMTPLGNPNSDINYISPPSLPGYIMDFVTRYLFPVFDRHAGTVDMNAAMRKNQVPGGDVLEQLRDSQAGPIRLETRRIENFIRDIGEICIPHLIQWFNTQHRMAILGESGWTMEDFARSAGTMVPAGVAPEAFWQEFKMTVSPGSMHGGNREREQVKYLTLFRSNALSMRTLLKKSNIEDPDGELQRIIEERSAGAEAENAGRTPRLTRGQRNAQIA